jgi:trk system potassium uptake protein
VSVAVVLTSTALLLLLTDFTLDEVLFEAVSAFCTVGLSTGITSEIGPGGHLLLTALMFVGRLGPITFASALALRSRPRRYELPVERVMIG